MTSRSQVSPDNLCSIDVTVIILCAPFFIFYIRAPTDFDGEKQQHTGLLVGQDIYENDDCDADGDRESGKDINRMGGTRPRWSAGRTKRSAVSCLTANQLTPPRCPPLSLRVCPGTHSPTHHSQHPLPPTTPQQPSPSRISASPHSPPPTLAHPTRTLPHTPQNAPAESSDYPLPTTPLSHAPLTTLLSQPHAPNPAGPQFYPSASNPAE